MTHSHKDGFITLWDKDCLLQEFRCWNEFYMYFTLDNFKWLENRKEWSFPLINTTTTASPELVEFV